MNLTAPPIQTGCRVTVVVPVRDEEHRLLSCLEALSSQSVSPETFDVILLLNNCKDESPQIASEFAAAFPEPRIHCVTKQLTAQQLNVGTVRRLLMDAAAKRLPSHGVILSTDADTIVAHDWIETNLDEIERGADIVGGEIGLRPEEFVQLDSRTRSHYEDDVAYRQAATHLESVLDADPNDTWPRHDHHFGASLACKKAVYQSLGGLPHVTSLEDVEFVRNAIRMDLRVRHSPDVKVWTAARTSGRAVVGLASQLKEWASLNEARMVDSLAFLECYFKLRRTLREAWRQGNYEGLAPEAAQLRISASELADQMSNASTFGRLHDALDIRGALWRRMAAQKRVKPIREATEQIRAWLERPDLVKASVAEERRFDIALRATHAGASIPTVQENVRVPRHRSAGSRVQTA